MQQINYLTALLEFQGFFVRGVERRKKGMCDVLDLGRDERYM
ncbi:MAG: hypothetical protein AB1630_04565 [bacterium]